MPEVSVGLGLERFTLFAHDDVYCVVDIVDEDTGSIALTPVPEAPIEVEADKARALVSAWRQRAEVEPGVYAVEQEQRAL